MAAMSDYLEGEIRKHYARSGSWTKPSVLAVALITAATSDADTGASANEVPNSNAYARTALNPSDANWTAASATDGLTDNASDITFPTATGSWGTITHIRMVDSTTHGAGNCTMHGALAASKAVGTGDIFKFVAGALDITFG